MALPSVQYVNCSYVVAKTALRNSAPDVTHAQVPSVAADSGP